MTPAHARLADELGGPLPPGLAGLDEADAAHLADAVEAARARQSAALRDATDGGLEFVPKLLRGPVKKVLFG
ncbi:hypothetical protein [Marmoricola sp. RAF53]|uniref:hypothetical protein n=1 Tax=Marmoricola sp. RAF53 TaxID=3233059 RepID=UPI003F9D381F